MAVNESSTPDLETIEPATCLRCQEHHDVKYCVTCRKDFCIDCIVTSHGNHNVLPIEHPAVKNIKLFSNYTCPVHDERLTMYCNDCRQPCCMECFEENHNGHSLSSITSVAKQADSLYAQLANVLPKVKSEYKWLSRKHANYVQSVDAAISGIRDQFRKFRRTVDNMETTMIQPLENELYKMRQIPTEQGRNLQEFECLVQFYKSATGDENNLDKVIFFSNCPAFENLKIDNQSVPENVSFRPAPLQNLETTTSLLQEQIIGNVVRSSGQHFENSEPSKSSNEDPIIDVISSMSFDARCFHGRVIAITNTDRWIISNPTISRWHTSSTDLNLVGRNFEHEKSLTVTDIISDVCIIPPFDLAYTDSKGKRVWRVAIGGCRSLVVDTSPFTPTGICFTSDQRLALGIEKPEKDDNSTVIRMYAMENLKFIREIGKDGEGKPLFSSIKSILQNTQEDFIVHDGNHLLCVSKHGNLKWKILKDFNQFCVDKFCNIVVATNEDIRVLDRNGNYMKTLLTKSDFLTEPMSLCINKAGSLWIGQRSSVKVVKYLTEKMWKRNPTSFFGTRTSW